MFQLALSHLGAEGPAECARHGPAEGGPVGAQPLRELRHARDGPVSKTLPEVMIDDEFDHPSLGDPTRRRYLHCSVVIRAKRSLPPQTRILRRFPGHGLSSDPSSGFRYPELVEDPDNDPLNHLDRIARIAVAPDHETIRASAGSNRSEKAQNERYGEYEARRKSHSVLRGDLKSLPATQTGILREEREDAGVFEGTATMAEARTAARGLRGRRGGNGEPR